MYSVPRLQDTSRKEEPNKWQRCSADESAFIRFQKFQYHGILIPIHIDQTPQQSCFTLIMTHRILWVCGIRKPISSLSLCALVNSLFDLFPLLSLTLLLLVTFLNQSYITTGHVPLQQRKLEDVPFWIKLRLRGGWSYVGINTWTGRIYAWRRPVYFCRDDADISGMSELSLVFLVLPSITLLYLLFQNKPCTS